LFFFFLKSIFLNYTEANTIFEKFVFFGLISNVKNCKLMVHTFEEK